MRDEITIVSLDIFDDTEDASNEDEDADRVENTQVPLPRHGSSPVGPPGSEFSRKAAVEYDSGDDEEAEHDDLREEAGQDDLLPHLEQVERSSRLDPSTPTLEQEGENIPSHEDLGNPADG